MRRIALAALVACAATAAEAQRFNWDALGIEFCRRTLAGDLAGMQPILSRQLQQDIQAAAGSSAMPPPRVLFQTYTNEVPVCEVRTRSAAIVEIRRSNPGGAGPAWTEYLVVAPAADGTTRVDDVLFATRRSDTLRARLHQYARN